MTRNKIQINRAPVLMVWGALVITQLGFIWLLLASPAVAAEVKLNSLVAGARTYTNVTVLGFNATDVYFTHEGGMANVKLKYLDATLQKLFHYEPEAAAEAEKQQIADDVRYNASMISNMVAQAQQAALNTRKAAATSEDNLADPISNKSLVGKPAPAIKGEKWIGEKPALEGKLVLVVFWAPWSIPCRKYIPELDRLQKKFADKLAVVSVTSEDEANIADMAEPKIEFASVLDPKAEFAATVGVTSIPFAMLVDLKGIVRYQGHPGAITDKHVESLLAKPAE